MKAALRCLAIFLGLQGLACARMSEITEKSKSRIRNAFNNGYAIDPLWFGRASADFLANLTRTQISGLNVEQARAVSQRMCHVATKREMGSYLSKLPADKFRAFLNETKHLNRGIRDRLKEVIVLRKMEEKSLVNWTQQDITEVETCLGGLSPKLLLRLVKTSLPNLLSVKSKIERDHTPSAGQMKAMCSGARHYYGSPSEWYRQALRMFPGCLQTKELDNIPGSLILDSIESLGRNILNKDQMKKVCRKLQDTTWTEEKINKLGGLTGCLSDEGIDRLDPIVLLNVLPNMDLSKIRRGKKRRLFKKITERKGGPANWTKEDVVRMVQLIPAMTLRELKSLNLARLTLSERRNIRNIYKDATPEQRKAIANGLIENKDISKWQSNDVNSLGSFLFELHIDEVFKIPPSALTKDVIGGLRRLPEISEALIRLIIK
ncbi:uncharacterized protein LOC125561231 [Nematostella vectensis]|uniref:uncharacterized protein LOC125561231 n=1 Tax=Nematostella vectensis TaxID=45351 RepID=UPI0020772E68|nr:uncharacterized protein LOC125561231 [Nematostella vectensis]